MKILIIVFAGIIFQFANVIVRARPQLDDDGLEGERSIGFNKPKKNHTKGAGPKYPFPPTPNPNWRQKNGPHMIAIIQQQDYADPAEVEHYYDTYDFEFPKKNFRNKNFSQKLKENQLLQVEMGKKAKASSKNQLEPVAATASQGADDQGLLGDGSGPLSIV